MTATGSTPDREEITVRFAEGVLDRMDESCRAQGFATRSELVSEALDRVAEQDG